MADQSDRDAPVAPRPLPPAVPLPPADDPWVRKLVPQVEAAIDDLVRSYIRQPFLHRVEHSLHVQLFMLLSEIPSLQGTHPLGATGYETGLIHKEWPETIPRASKARDGRPARRGNFDLAILPPSQLASVVSVEQFTKGVIQAPIAIELGLGYGDDHLTGDIEKLRSSEVRHAYLVHFSHVRSRKHDLTEKQVESVGPPLQIAYVRHDIEEDVVRVKRRSDVRIGPPKKRATLLE
ncbi:hypothetical protein [Terrabacter sp. RAF57]|uniref:hypothetical protein n=1 Tax=Terrabacter sp. RAF57 TaxID=3233063 RepID=UPI003F97447A